MKKIFFALCLLSGFAACNSIDNGSPTAAIDGMFTAMKNGKMDDIKKFITRADISMIESLEKLGNSLDSDAVNKMKTKMSDEFRDKVKDIKYTLKNEKIDGDKATVDAEVTEGEKKESHTFNLVKEDGAWKISLLNSGDGMFNSMKGNMGADRKDVEAGLERLKNMDHDSLKMLMNKGMEAIEKMDSISKLNKH